MAEPEEAAPARGAEAPEPDGGRWSRLYALVLGVLALEIAGLWILARAFR